MSLVSRSPSDPSDVLGTFPVAEAAAVEEAVTRARAAFPAWRDAGLEARSRVLQRFRDLAIAAVDHLAPLIAREVGKALWDARAEAGLVGPKVDVTLAEGMRFVSTVEADSAARADFQPRGVLAVLGPFNFPAHLPNGHIVPALALGNTVVFKPSELAPAAAEFVLALWREAGLPEGVLQVVHGAAETGRALAAAPVDGILFTGSWAAGRALREATLDHPEKLLALEMGGKNALAVLADADLELTVAEAALSIAATTGQRCSCASRLFVDRRLMDEFAERLAGVLSGIRIGPPLEPGVFMGPLVSEAAHAKLMHYRELAAEAGAERIALPAPDAEPPFVGPGLVRFADARQDHAYQRDEIFGPEAALYPIDGLDEAIAAINDSDYGLVASVMTADRGAFEHCIGRVRTGLLNWNRATVGASGKLPFGGRGRSGNERPAGVTATLYCATPQAVLEGPAAFDPDTLPPGMPRP